MSLRGSFAVACIAGFVACGGSVSPLAPTIAASAAGPAPVRACVLSSRHLEPQPIPALQGFLGGPSVFTRRDDDSGETARAIVRLSPEGAIQPDALPPAFADTVALTTSHTVFFRFSIDTQQETLEVARRGSSEIVGALEGVDHGNLAGAIDGTDGSSVLLLHRHGALALLHVARGGHVAWPTVAITEHWANAFALAPGPAGTVLVAWTETEEGKATSGLWIARATEDGVPLGVPAKIDSAPGEQPVADVTVGLGAAGVIVAWDPIVSTRAPTGSGQDTTLGVSLRVFRVATDGAALKTRELALTSHAGPIASVGGYIGSNRLQSVPLGGDVLLSWANEGDAFASLAFAWSPMNLGRSVSDGDAVLKPLGPRAAALVSARLVYPDAGLSWPSVEAIRLGCAGD